jgi:hypothetical protein
MVHRRPKPVANCIDVFVINPDEDSVTNARIFELGGL